MSSDQTSTKKVIHLLLVEDNKADVVITQKVLESSRYPFVMRLAPNGEEALVHLQDPSSSRIDRPDLILLDLSLPRLDGVEFLSKLRGHPELGNIPVIVISASNSREDFQVAHSLNVVYFILKPLDPAQFARLEDFLGEIWIKKFGVKDLENVVSRVSWIDHQGEKILFLDFIPGTDQQAIQALEKLSQELSEADHGSVLLLADLRNAGYSAMVALEWFKYREFLHLKCRKGAIFGAKHVVSVAVNTFLTMATYSGLELGHKLRLFEGAMTAKQWLVQRVDPQAFLP